MSKILVLGGSGFIGRAICRKAAAEGHDVVSISRSGRPEGLDGWASGVTWAVGNVLEPETWRDQLDGCDAVIHCAGIIREHPDQGITYERMHRDAVDLASWEAEHAGVEHFVLLSAADVPVMPERYRDSKRDGEVAVRGRQLHETILRPSFVYGEDRAPSVAVAGVMKAAEVLPFAPEWLHPLRVEQVAAAAVRAATEPGYEGVVNIDLIEYLADGHWESDVPQRQPMARGKSGLLLGAGLAVGLAAGIAWGASRR